MSDKIKAVEILEDYALRYKDADDSETRWNGYEIYELLSGIASEIEGLKDEPVVEVPSDTEMLDWLIKQRRYVDYEDFDTEPGSYICVLVSDSHWTHLVDDQNMFDTPRAAIKAAMEKEQSK